MTEGELETMALMWSRHASVKTIAETLGYGVSTIHHYAKRDRERFPRRNRAVDETTIWPAAEQVFRGEKRARDVARELNVSEESVMKRVRILCKRAREGIRHDA